MTISDGSDLDGMLDVLYSICRCRRRRREPCMKMLRFLYCILYGTILNGVVP